MSNQINHHVVDQEESLSLSDFPLNSGVPDHRRRSSSNLPDFFEFSNNSISDVHVSHAEDIISCGKLMPYKQSRDDPVVKTESNGCDSMPDLNSTRSNTRLIRSSRSVDSEKVHRNSNIVAKPEASDIYRSFSKVKSDPTALKPRWCVLMFGLVKFPPVDMDLREMRSRQVRRIREDVSPAEEIGGKYPVNRKKCRGFDLLKVLSCKDHTNVAVTASVRTVPRN